MRDEQIERIATARAAVVGALLGQEHALALEEVLTVLGSIAADMIGRNDRPASEALWFIRALLEQIHRVADARDD